MLSQTFLANTFPLNFQNFFSKYNSFFVFLLILVQQEKKSLEYNQVHMIIPSQKGGRPSSLKERKLENLKPDILEKLDEKLKKQC